MAASVGISLATILAQMYLEYKRQGMRAEDFASELKKTGKISDDEFLKMNNSVQESVDLWDYYGRFDE